jgi:hypothetical protein
MLIKPPRRPKAAACLAVTACMTLAAAWAQRFPKPPPAAKPVVDQYLVLGNATRGSGEPMVAVDPTNPRDIIVVGMGSLQILPGFRAPVTAGMTEMYWKVPFSTITWLAVTHDGGTTWKVKRLPILSGKFVRCPDPFAGVTKAGIFIAGCEPRQASPPYFGESADVVSFDHGKTWSPRANGVNSFNRAPYPRFAAGLEPRMGGNSPWDRPFLTFDDQTGVVYLTDSGGQTAAPTGSGAKWRQQSYVTASHDDGRSWGTIYADDDPQWPQLARASLAAGHGKLAEVYVASSVPLDQHAHCPCEVFGVSSNEGRTFERHVMRDVRVWKARGAFLPGGSVGNLTADPTTAGRYSVLRYVAGPVPHYEVSTSDDYGRSWSKFIAIGSAPGASWLVKPWLEYSRFGALGLEWRAIYPNYSYDVWAAISTDGGKSFSPPLRISSARSPGTDYYRNDGNFGDDVQDFSMSRNHMFVVWSDYRSGFLGTWIGRVSLSAFQCRQAQDCY